MSYTLEQIQYAVRSKGYKWFTANNYDVSY